MADVLQQARDALWTAREHSALHFGHDYSLTMQTREALNALDAAIAQRGEPVALVAEVHMSRYTLEWVDGPLPEGTPLYTVAPPQAQEAVRSNAPLSPGLASALGRLAAQPVAPAAPVAPTNALLEAVDSLLETAHCDCPNGLRHNRGEHLSGCHLFDLNIARVAMLAAAPAGVAPVAPEGWLPIETAPRDGTRLLCVWECAWGPMVYESWCNGFVTARDGGDFWRSHSLVPVSGRPTHWMPLPAAPAGDARNVRGNAPTRAERTDDEQH